MAEFFTGPLTATERNASDLRAMIRAELEAFDADTSIVKTQKEQIEALEAHQEQYLGVFDDGERLVAATKFNDWRAGDQIAFESLRTQIRYKLDRNKEEHQLLPGNPQGIFALTSDEVLGFKDRVHVSKMLLDGVIDLSTGREIRIPCYYHEAASDPALFATSHRGFKHVPQIGRVAGVLQELAIRPADSAEQAP